MFYRYPPSGVEIRALELWCLNCLEAYNFFWSGSWHKIGSKDLKFEGRIFPVNSNWSTIGFVGETF